MNKTKRKNLLIVLVVLLLALAVGYAAFQTILNVNGTATLSGNWEVKFVEPSIITEEHGTVSITEDTATVNAELGYPGDGCEVTLNIKNEGNIPAVLTSLDTFLEDGTTAFSSDDVTIELPDIKGEKLGAGETCEVKIAIKWNEDSEATTGDVKFNVKFTYDQDTTPADVEAGHEAHN